MSNRKSAFKESLKIAVLSFIALGLSGCGGGAEPAKRAYSICQMRLIELPHGVLDLNTNEVLSEGFHGHESYCDEDKNCFDTCYVRVTGNVFCLDGYYTCRKE